MIQTLALTWLMYYTKRIQEKSTNMFYLLQPHGPFCSVCLSKIAGIKAGLPNIAQAFPIKMNNNSITRQAQLNFASISFLHGKPQRGGKEGEGEDSQKPLLE